jgi:hypothetical protein
MNDDTWRGVTTGMIWLAGAWLIWVLWDTHPSNQLLDVLLGFVLYVAGFFYCFAFVPIHWFVERWIHPPRRHPITPP